jgi:Protein of unknown function (DUF402)
VAHVTWRAGDVVVYRHRSFDGRYLTGYPLTVIEEGPAGIVGYLPHGTEVSRPYARDGRDLRTVPLAERWSTPRAGQRLPFTLVGEHGAEGWLLFIFPRGRAHSLWLFDSPDGPLGWYVNLEEPHVLGGRTISTRDHVLDIWVPAATGEPRWKDEDELEGALAAGRMTADEGNAARAEGERVVRERPWPTGWEDFRPDPGAPQPTLFDGWDVP